MCKFSDKKQKRARKWEMGYTTLQPSELVGFDGVSFLSWTAGWCVYVGRSVACLPVCFRACLPSSVFPFTYSTIGWIDVACATEKKDDHTVGRYAALKSCSAASPCQRSLILSLYRHWECATHF